MHPEIFFTSLLTAWACTLPGSFLVLRRMSLMSDAISHSILPGIVTGYLFNLVLPGPWVWVGAGTASMLTVFLTETLLRSQLLKQDAAIGLVFPAMFSIGVILVAMFASQIHLDTDAVLLGELAFIPLDRVTIGPWSLPRGLLTASALATANLALTGLFFKELKITTFDPGLARSLGFRPDLFHYGLMLVMSLTAVGAFDAVGSILMVAYVVAPAAAAYLLFHSLLGVLAGGLALGALGAVLGYLLAWGTDTNIGGATAVALGAIFFIVLLVSPRYGLLTAWRRRKRQRWDFAVGMLLVHLSHHQGCHDEPVECTPSHLVGHIVWTENFAAKVIERAVREALARRDGGILILTEEGRRRAEALVEG